MIWDKIDFFFQDSNGTAKTWTNINFSSVRFLKVILLKLLHLQGTNTLNIETDPRMRFKTFMIIQISEKDQCSLEIISFNVWARYVCMCVCVKDSGVVKGTIEIAHTAYCLTLKKYVFNSDIKIEKRLGVTTRWNGAHIV